MKFRISMLDDRILKTNKNTVARTNKEQITFFRKFTGDS